MNSPRVPKFEKQVFELEQLIERLEKETLSLDEMLQIHKKAKKLLNSCQERLLEAEKQCLDEPGLFLQPSLDS